MGMRDCWILARSLISAVVIIATLAACAAVFPEAGSFG